MKLADHTNLNAAEELFNTVFEQDAMGMALRAVGPFDSRWLRVNQKFCDMLGYTREELLQLTSIDISLPDEQDLAVEYNERLLRGDLSSYSREKPYLRKDGTIIWTNIWLSAVLGPDGKPTQIISVIQDISEQKLAEQTLVEERTSELRDAKEDAEAATELFSKVYQSSPALFSISSLKDSRHINVNAAWSSIMGYSHEEALHKTALELKIWVKVKDRAKFIESISRFGFIHNYETVLRAKNGVEKDMLLSGELIDYQGEKALLIVGQDITERKIAEREIMDSKKKAEIANQAKSEFLSAMSHELRTPMNAVLGFAEMLNINPREPLSKKQQSYVNHILKGGRHLMELIDDVLALSQIEAGKLSINFELITADKIIGDSLQLIQLKAQQEGIEILDQIARDKLPVLLTDRTRLTQVLLNLLSNAVKYNHKGGTVTLSCEETRNQMFRISVADTGLGIAEIKQQYLFKSFERLGRETGDIEGTGIGLVVTKRLIELLGGEIGYHSEEGKGSTFWVDVPLSRKQAQVKKLPRATKKTTRKTKPNGKDDIAHIVLYIEDNRANIQLMERIIGELENTHLVTAYSAELGLELATSNLPDLILMDINLPGMSGIEALKQLRDTTETKHIPVIAITAAAMSDEIEAGKKAGFNDYVTKPINVGTCIRIIEELLDSIEISD